MIKCDDKKTVCDGSVFDIAEDFSNITVSVLQFFHKMYAPDVAAKIVSNCISCAMAVVADDDGGIEYYSNLVADSLTELAEVDGKAVN